MEAREALKKKNLRPLRLSHRDGLALINNTSYAIAIASTVVHESRKLSKITDLSGAYRLMLSGQAQLLTIRLYIT